MSDELRVGLTDGMIDARTNITWTAMESLLLIDVELGVKVSVIYIYIELDWADVDNVHKDWGTYNWLNVWYKYLHSLQATNI